jgi:hypothetical protein
MDLTTNTPAAAAPAPKPAAPAAAPAPAVVKPVGPDFCLVQLTAAGVAAAGQHSLRFSNGRQDYVFQPGQPRKIARYEWDLALSQAATAKGQLLFELVPNPAPAAKATPAPAAAPSAAQTTAEEKK